MEIMHIYEFMPALNNHEYFQFFDLTRPFIMRAGSFRWLTFYVPQVTLRESQIQHNSYFCSSKVIFLWSTEK